MGFFWGSEKFGDTNWKICCSVYKENKAVLKELNDCQVNVVYIDACSKNACDQKMKQLLYKFGNIFGANSTIVVLTSTAS